jgi:hypothetical protein
MQNNMIKLASDEDGKWHPFKITQSVYSFFLLNVKATVEKGVLYPSINLWEDIAFNQLCREKDLLVVKCNTFIHTKDFRFHGAVGSSPLKSNLELKVILFPTREEADLSELLSDSPQTMQTVWDKFKAKKQIEGKHKILSVQRLIDTRNPEFLTLQDPVVLNTVCTLHFHVMYHVGEYSLEDIYKSISHEASESSSLSNQVLECIKLWKESADHHLFTNSSYKELKDIGAVHLTEPCRRNRIREMIKYKFAGMFCTSEDEADSRPLAMLSELREILTKGFRPSEGQAEISLVIPSSTLLENHDMMNLEFGDSGDSFVLAIKKFFERFVKTNKDIEVMEPQVWCWCSHPMQPSANEDALFIITIPVQSKHAAENGENMAIDSEVGARKRKEYGKPLSDTHIPMYHVHAFMHTYTRVCITILYIH